jgi:hypothetical protein
MHKGKGQNPIASVLWMLENRQLFPMLIIVKLHFLISVPFVQFLLEKEDILAFHQYIIPY